MTGSRKHCGVWQRHSVSRRGIVCITPLSVITMVSEVGTATPAASCTSSAATQSAMIRWSTSGRAASCSKTPQSPGPAMALQRHPGRVRARHPAPDDPGDLRKPALGQHVPDLLDVPGGHHDQDLVDPGSLLERGHAVLDQRLAAQPQQLLGQRRADPLTDAAAQHHRDHPHEPDSNPPPAAVFTPAKLGKALDSLGVFLRGGGRTAGYIE